MIDRETDRRYAKNGSDWSCEVKPVKFGVDKYYGIGELRRRLELRKMRFPMCFQDEPVLNVERALSLLKGYHLDQNGMPIKKDDHCPDALLCAILNWSPRQETQPHIY